jgi:GGDEF domain-containing protein
VEIELKKSKEELETKVQERTRELEYYATTDSMTGVYNRRIGLLLLEKEIVRSQRTSMSLQ